MIKRLLPAVFLLLCLAGYALGLGVAPASTAAKPGEVLTYTIFNNEKREITVDIEGNGSLEGFKRSLSFTSKEQAKAFKLTVPEEANQDASILISDGNKEIAADIEVRIDRPPIPTGKAASVESGDDDDDRFFDKGLYILFSMVVLGNITYFAVRKQKKRRGTRPLKAESPSELLSVLKSMRVSTFKKHANPNKNEFAELMEAKDEPDLAYRMYDITDGKEMIALLENYHDRQTEKDAEKLKQEIVQLKGELESFDFRDFERQT